jgi:hypothetical protein
MAYRVIAGYVTAQTKLPQGRAYIDFPRGAELPSDVPAAEVEWLLRSDQIEEIGSSEPEPEPEPEPEGEGDETVEIQLEDLDKDDLLKIAEDENVEIDKRWGVEKLAAAIREAR